MKLRLQTSWLVPVLLVGGLLALLLPQFVRERGMVTNAKHESAAVGELKSLVQSQNAYKSAHGCFSDSLCWRELSSTGDDYLYSCTVKSKNASGQILGYEITAAPRVPGKTGMRYFTVDEAGVVRYELMRPVTAQSPILE